MRADGPDVRIALLIPTLDRSGAEKQFTLLALGLKARANIDLHVATLTRGGPWEAELAAAGVAVMNLQKRWKVDPAALWRLRDWLRAVQPDVLHTWLFAANAYGRLAAGACPTMRVLVSERCVDSWKSPWQFWLDRQLLSRTHRLVGNSQSVVDFYREQGVDDRLLSLVPNGIEVPAAISIDERNALRSAARRELGWPDDAHLAVYVGRLARQKRVGDLIWAAETLRQIRPSLRLAIVGDGPERAALEHLSKSVQANEHVAFLGHRSDASRWLQAADAFWLASEFEGMSNSLMEAMALGLPVVVSDIAPNRELVDQAGTGLLVKTGDSVGFMQATRELIDDAAFAAKLGRRAQDKMRTKFSIDRMIERYAALYQQLSDWQPPAK